MPSARRNSSLIHMNGLMVHVFMLFDRKMRESKSKMIKLIKMIKIFNLTIGKEKEREEKKKEKVYINK